MPRKERDYHAEYVAAKQRATARGYKSEREYKKVRKELGLPRNVSLVPKRVLDMNTDQTTLQTAHSWRMRREAKEWSDRHSLRESSRYKPNMTDAQVERYHNAYVRDITQVSPDKIERARRKLQALHDYLVPDYLSEQEWEGKYPK